MIPPFTPRSAIAPAPPILPLKVQLFRYLFFGWLFRNASAGSALERSAALRHNREQAKWLPIYLGRWAITGALLLALEWLSERLTGNSPLSAALELCVIFAIMFELITTVYWAFLRRRETQ
jgi:hypothetical protein